MCLSSPTIPLTGPDHGLSRSSCSPTPDPARPRPRDGWLLKIGNTFAAACSIFAWVELFDHAVRQSPHLEPHRPTITARQHSNRRSPLWSRSEAQLRIELQRTRPGLTLAPTIRHDRRVEPVTARQAAKTNAQEEPGRTLQKQERLPWPRLA